MEHRRCLLDHIKAVVSSFYLSAQKREERASAVIESVDSILVWRRVQIGEGWALSAPSKGPLLLPAYFLKCCSPLRCQPSPWLPHLYFLYAVICLAWLNIRALGCFSNYSLPILLINECEYWWGEPCAFVHMPVCLSPKEGGRVSRLCSRQVWVTYAVSHHRYNTLVTGVQ